MLDGRRAIRNEAPCLERKVVNGTDRVCIGPRRHIEREDRKPYWRKIPTGGTAAGRGIERDFPQKSYVYQIDPTTHRSDGVPWYVEVTFWDGVTVLRARTSGHFRIVTGQDLRKNYLREDR